MIIQIFFVGFFGFTIWKLLQQYLKKSVSLWELFAWSALWLSAIVIVILPETTTRLAHIVGVGRGVDLVLYVGVAILFYALFRMYIRLHKIERDISKIVTDIALKKSNR